MEQQTGPGPEPGHKWKAALHTDKLYVWAEHTGGRKRPVKFRGGGGGGSLSCREGGAA